MYNNRPTKTGWVIIVLLLMMLVWELYVIMFAPELKTISEEIWHMNDRSIIVASIFFFIAGHFFWPRRK